MRNRNEIIKGLKAYAERLAYEEKLMAEGRGICTPPEVRRERIVLLCDSIALLNDQAEFIEGLEADLKETLDVVTEQGRKLKALGYSDNDTGGSQ